MSVVGWARVKVQGADMKAGSGLGRRGMAITIAILAGLAPLLTVACKSENSSSPPVSQTGNVVPAVKVKDLQGKELDLTTTRGKVLLINFWATWCGPCKHEIPDLSRLHRKYRDQGLLVLGFAVDSGSASEVTPFLSEFGIDYPVYMADDVRDQFYREPGIPMTIVVDRKGQVVKKLFGLTSADVFESTVLPLLNEGA
ncbi:MAG: redoxin domain-containing protein [Acidobacteria bacterium]|nr:redoxin domain-containing protein [Acidobacteriota bacterium]